MKFASVFACIAAASAIGLTIVNGREALARSKSPLGEPIDSVSDRRFLDEVLLPSSERRSSAVIVATDYECGACRVLEKRLKKEGRLLEKTGLGYVMSPLDGHPAAKAGAIAAICADRHGRFVEMQRELFENERIGSASWSSLAEDAGIPDTSAFVACMKSDAANAVLERHLRAAKRLGVVGTPTIVVGHDVYVGTPNGFSRILHAFADKAGLK